MFRVRGQVLRVLASSESQDASNIRVEPIRTRSIGAQYQMQIRAEIEALRLQHHLPQPPSKGIEPSPRVEPQLRRASAERAESPNGILKSIPQVFQHEPHVVATDLLP